MDYVSQPTTQTAVVKVVGETTEATPAEKKEATAVASPLAPAQVSSVTKHCTSTLNTPRYLQQPLLQEVTSEPHGVRSCRTR